MRFQRSSIRCFSWKKENGRLCLDDYNFRELKWMAAGIFLSFCLPR